MKDSPQDRLGAHLLDTGKTLGHEEDTMEQQKPTAESIDKKVWAKPRRVVIVPMPTYKKPKTAP